MWRCCNGVMKEEQLVEIRRARLREAIDRWCDGNQAEFARKVRRAPSQISDMLSGSKSFGAKVARMLAGVITSSGSYRWACSLRDLRTAWRVHGVSKLDDLCRVHGIARPAKHGALADCQALTELLAKPNMTWPGKTHLGELLVLSSA